MAESGFAEVGFHPDAWLGMVAPANTPAEIVTFWARLINDSLKSPSISKRFAITTRQEAAHRSQFLNHGQCLFILQIRPASFCLKITELAATRCSGFSGRWEDYAHVWAEQPFSAIAPEKIPYTMERYNKEVNRLYGVMDKRLADREVLATDYSVADIACYPWAMQHERQGQNISDFPNLKRWLDVIAARPAASGRTS